ncbi:hypothetical protein B296_00057120 [Ensete ventricosum]|uniref:Uncharacterized protein n=1 Tax=Ensete ventricosum TaxID=4639 RepID=A0A426WYA1_ENSVE|nr:hypothetical protein B296_00057120 [Ensete ventricosum]
MEEARRGERPRPGLKLLLFLHASLFLNVFFFCYLVLSRHQPLPRTPRPSAASPRASATRATPAATAPSCCCSTAPPTPTGEPPPSQFCMVSTEDPLFLEPILAAACINQLDRVAGMAVHEFSDHGQ